MTISRVLITGGTGFVGHWMERTCPKNVIGGVAGRKHYNAWESDDFIFDAIVHLAPVSPARVLRYAQKHRARVLFASSGAVYEGTNEYANNKRAGERECLDSGVDVVIARLFSFVGAHLKNLYAITRFIEAAKAGKPLEVWGGGHSVRTYLYGEDLGRWMWKLLLEGEGTYDVGGETPFFIRDAARLVAEIVPTKIKFTKPDYPFSCYVPNITRARELGCEESIGLRDAIERTINESNRLHT